jgi:hypothetical protein
VAQLAEYLPSKCDALSSNSSTSKEKNKLINKVRHEKGNVTIDTNEIQKIIQKYLENLYSSKLENQEADKFLDTYDPLKLNIKNIRNLNTSKISIKIETVIKNLPARKSPSFDGFTAEFHQTFKEKLIPMLLKLFHKI